VPNYAISKDVRQILKIRRLLARGIPQQMQMLQNQSANLQQMATMADQIDINIPRIALNEIAGQKG